MTESGMASRVNTDAGDMCVSIAGLAKSAASAESAICFPIRMIGKAA